MGSKIWRVLPVAACIVLCASQPVKQLPVLKEQPAEVLFRTEPAPKEPFLLECVAVGGDGKQIKYTWHKNGQPFDYKTTPDITQRENEGTLVFSKPVSTIEGQYQCFAESDLGIASSRVITVRRAYITAPKVTPLKHKPIEGKPFKLDCSIPDAYPKPSIVWKYEQRSKRILDAPDGTLYFSNVTQEDVSKVSKYVCQAESPAVDEPVVLAEHYIEEVVANKEANNGQLVPQYLSQDMVAKAGNVTMIYCIYGGTPLAHPDWTYEGKSLNDNKPDSRITRYNRSAGRRLLIKDTYLSDQGTYTCEVNNGVGKSQKHSIHLTVVSAPEYVKKPESQMIVKEGQDVTIPCQVKGVNAPKVSRTYNAKPLTSSDRISVASGAGDEVSVADLTIKNVQKSDKGYYGCKAENDHGDLYTETLLYVA